MPLSHEDTEMAEGSMAASDDDGGEDGDDGDEGDDDEGSVSAQESPSKLARTLSPMPSDLPHMRELPHLGSKGTDMSGMDDLPGPPLPKLEIMEGKSGSPLKNVALTISSLTSPVKTPETAEDPLSPFAPPPQASDELPAAEPTTLDDVMQLEVIETAPSEIPLPPPEPTMAEVVSAVEERLEEEEEEEMLLDIVENTNNANVGAPQVDIPAAPELPPAEVIPPIQQAEIPTVEPEPSEVPVAEPEQPSTPAPVEELVVEKVVEQPVDDDGDLPDLLGGLEKQLNEPQAAPAPVPEVVEQEAEPDKVAEPEKVVEPQTEPKAEPETEPEAEPELVVPVDEEKVEEAKESEEDASGA